jgi:hypothetical protein
VVPCEARWKPSPRALRPPAYRPGPGGNRSPVVWAVPELVADCQTRHERPHRAADVWPDREALTMARPRKQVDVAEIVRLHRDGLSFPVIARRMRLGLGTVHRASHGAVDALQPFQNLSKTILQTEPHENSAKPAANVRCNPPREPHSAPSKWSAWRAVGAVGNLLKLRDLAEMNFHQVIAEGASVETILEGFARWISWWDNTGWQNCRHNLALAIRNRLWLTAPPGISARSPKQV